MNDISNEKSSPGGKLYPNNLCSIKENNTTIANVKARARGHWHGILSAAGLAEYLKKNIPCPICGPGRDRFSWTNLNSDGGYYCRHCGHGDGFDLLQHVFNFTFADVIEFVASYLGIRRRGSIKTFAKNITVENTKGNNQTSAELLAISKWLWDNGKAIQLGDIADIYLRKRGIELNQYPSVLRLHPNLKCGTGICPGILAKLTAPDGTFAGLLRTFLTTNGEKAFGKDSKKFMRGSIPCGSAIRLYAPSDILGIAEGIETTLACYITFGIPVWATTGNKCMENVSIPSCVKKVEIFGDHDANGAGQNSAQILARRLHGEGRVVRVLIPPTINKDWLDILTDGQD